MPILTLIVFSPLLAAVVLMVLPERSRISIRVTSLFAAAVSLALSIVALTRFLDGNPLRETLPLIPKLGISYSLYCDGWSSVLLLLTGIILFAGCWASWTVAKRDREFYVLLLVLSTGVFGVFVCLDLFLLFLFYEIAVLPMYLLIGIWGSSKRIPPKGPLAFAMRIFDVGGREYAAMKLTLMLLGGSALILVGILAMANQGAGTPEFNMEALARVHFPRELQMWAFPLLWIGFGSLAGVWPFHTWSPDGHASAPTAVSMLHAGVLMKLGAFGVIRIGMVLLPEGAQAWAPWVGGIAALNVIYGALSAMAQTDLKYVIAYSSVSHMGVVLLGAATMTTNGWNGAVFQMFAHGVMTGMFFALVGLVYERAHSRDIPSMGGFGKMMPGVAVCFTLAGLSSLGLPGTAGFVAEFLVFLGAWESNHAAWMVPAVLGAFFTAVYVLRATRMIFWGPSKAENFPHLSDARGVEWVALLLLGAMIVLFGVWPALALHPIDITTMSFLPRITGLLPH
ncbi:MAG: NADH-quinone oxidoreductase subunit M [Planctomycetes bacterium]|nr:NADH-quinone oxidoreductase subunit M [Planctomycetota bacterium]